MVITLGGLIFCGVSFGMETEEQQPQKSLLERAREAAWEYTPQPFKNVINKMSEYKKMTLLLALAAALGYEVYRNPDGTVAGLVKSAKKRSKLLGAGVGLGLIGIYGPERREKGRILKELCGSIPFFEFSSRSLKLLLYRIITWTATSISSNVQESIQNDIERVLTKRVLEPKSEFNSITFRANDFIKKDLVWETHGKDYCEWVRNRSDDIFIGVYNKDCIYRGVDEDED